MDRVLTLTWLFLLCLLGTVICQPMKLMNHKWASQYEPHHYMTNEKDLDPNQAEHFGYTKQAMDDLNEVGDLVGGGNADLLSILRPYYSVVDMSQNGNRMGWGSYMHVLPDEEYGDKPMYSLGGSLSGGLEPSGIKSGYLSRLG